MIRGDRAGCQVHPRGGPRDESAARREKNVAETTLGKGAEHASPTVDLRPTPRRRV